MSYASKRSVVSIIASMLLTVAYSIYALGETAPALNDLRSWAAAMLVFIGISTGVMIVIQILFHIGLAIGIAVMEREQDDKRVERIIKSSMIEDERDRLINLKSAHIGYICVSFGFAAALLTLAVGSPVVYALHMLFGSFYIGSIFEGCVSIYLDEKGVLNG